MLPLLAVLSEWCGGAMCLGVVCLGGVLPRYIVTAAASGWVERVGSPLCFMKCLCVSSSSGFRSLSIFGGVVVLWVGV